MQPMLYGGEQEKGVRSSTENVHSILGMDKALVVAIGNLQEDQKKIEYVKEYFIKQLKFHFKKVEFNGKSSDLEKSSYTILNVRFPVKEKMLLFNLDLAGIAVSGGSACQSGANKGSHVLSAFLNDREVEKTSIRFSFSKLTTINEIDFSVEKLLKMILT